MLWNHNLLKCGIVILLPLVRLKIDLSWKNPKYPKMENTISKRIPVNASTAEPSGKPLSGDKTLRIEPSIRFYEILDRDNTEEVEEAEILITHNKSLAASNQNLVKRKFPYIEMFDHEVPAVVSAIRYLTSEVFEHLDITSPMEVYQRIAYTQRILKLSWINNC